MDKKKKIFTMIVLSLFAVGVLSFGTYALYNIDLLTDNNSISTGQVKMSYSESNEITLNNVVPTSDNKGISSTNYFEFKVNTYIKTNKEMTMNYNIVLEPLNVDSSYTKFSDSDIKVYLTKVDNNTEVLVTGPISIKMLNQYVLKSQEETFNKNDTERSTTYRLRTWLDYNFDASKINEKTYSYKFRVNVNNEAAPKRLIDKSGANAPKLTSNMIPVYYDETNKAWKKADDTNSLVEYTYKLGDLDNNGWINSADLGILLNITKCYNKKANTKECIPGDMNSDGYITEEDKNILTSSEYYGKKATIEKTGYVKSDNTWYDYDDKMWANAVTVSETNRATYLKADAGTTIPMSDINTMWVWVPRYTYTYLNTNTPQEINVKFESGTASTGTIKCTNNVTGTSSTSETCTDTTNGGLKAGTSTYTHPAFWWDKNDNNVRETGEELTGIWVGKFEVSSDTTCTASDYVAVGSGCNLQTIRPQIKPNVASWRGAQVGTFFNGIQKMRESGNKYGFATTDETHMMKNMEWGAVTYLSHSKYGINKEVAINSANTYTTGCGPQSAGSTSSGSTCNSYTTTLGQSASTTGNVYGVYDMSGGSYEYMMGNMVYSNGQQMSGYKTSNNYNSAFTGILYDGGRTFTGIYAFPSKRYYDKYSYGTRATEYTRGKLGDATKEMAPTGTSGNWYSDYANFPSSSTPWFLRGGSYSDGASAGAFRFSHYYGSAYTYYSARAVLPGALD